jgi:hypothetical protein
VFIVSGILTATRDNFLSADGEGVSAAQTDVRIVRRFPRSRKSLEVGRL